MPDPRHAPYYPLAQAAQLVHMSPRRVRAWLGADAAARPTVVRTEGAPPDAASFLDLVEMWAVKDLLSQPGVSILKLRAKLAEAARIEGVDHPLAQRKFLVEGAHLFLDKGDVIYELGRGGQVVFEKIIRSRATELEFDAAGLAKRWWPMGLGKVVVIDPEYLCGEPRIEGHRLSTRFLAQAVRAEPGGVPAVAQMYGIEEQSVRLALEYQGVLAA